MPKAHAAAAMAKTTGSGARAAGFFQGRVTTVTTNITTADQIPSRSVICMTLFLLHAGRHVLRHARDGG